MTHAGDIIKDPITGIEYVVERVLSGKQIVMPAYRTPLLRGSSAERCVDLGDRPRADGKAKE